MAGFCREDILMEDNDILVVHKHAGMAVQNARMGQMDLEHALLNYLAKQTRAETPGQARTQIPYLAVVHRLDQPVEGVLVFAKNKDAAGKLGRQVKDGTMKKEYLAVCEGKIEKQGVQKFEDFLVKDGRSNTSCVVQPGTAGAKKAVLEYEVIRTQENRTLGRSTSERAATTRSASSFPMRDIRWRVMQNMGRKRKDLWRCARIISS